MSITPARTLSGPAPGLPPPPPGRGGQRVSEFLLPDGRSVLVALPRHIDAVRKRYAQQQGHHHADPPVQVEVVMHGSDEHRDLLHQSRAHHASRRAALRAQLGEEVADELEAARAQLDALDAQLRAIEHAAADDHAARLNPNFSKFGFDAKLRTYVDEEEVGDGEDGGGVASSAASSYSVPKADEAGVMKLVKRPVIRQYFHRGLLWRSSEQTEVMSFELFFDLLYVGIIAINGDHAAEEADGHELLRFVVTFTMSWRIWSDVQQVVSWFENDDILQRIEILFLIACLLGVTTNNLQAFSAGQDSFVQLVSFYLAARLFTAINYAVTGYLVPLVKGMMIVQALNILFGAAFWIASTTVSTPTMGEFTATTPGLEHRQTHEEGGEGAAEGPLNATRIVLVFIALAIDLFGSLVPVALFRYSTTHQTAAARRLSRFFEFYPAINIEHKVERTNAFISLVFGYSVVGVMFQSTGVFPLNAFLGKAILGLTQAAVFNWLYFDVDGGNIRTHAIRRSVYAATVWQWAHFFLSMAFILSAAGLSKMVLLTDCPNAPLDGLTALYQGRSGETMSLGLRLYYCVGLGISLACMGLIALCHEHKVPVGACRLPKWARLANRFGVSIVFMCLPAAQSLNSMSLVVITTCLCVWTLFFELWAKSCRQSSLFGQDKACHYTASCAKGRIDAATKDNGEIDFVELGRSEKTAAVTIN